MVPVFLLRFFFMVASLHNDGVVLVFLVDIYIKLTLVTIVGQLIVSAIVQGGAGQSFAVLQSLAQPDNVHIVRSDLLVLLGIGAFSYGLLDQGNKFLI